MTEMDHDQELAKSGLVAPPVTRGSYWTDGESLFQVIWVGPGNARFTLQNAADESVHDTYPGRFDQLRRVYPAVHSHAA